MSIAYPERTRGCCDVDKDQQTFAALSNIIRVLRPVRLITAFEWKVMLDHTNYCHPIMLQLHAMCLAMDTKEDQARQGTVAWCGSAALVSMGCPASHRLSPPSGYADHNAAHRNNEHHLIVHSMFSRFPVSGDLYDFLSDLHSEVRCKVSLSFYIYIWPTVHLHSLQPPEHLTKADCVYHSARTIWNRPGETSWRCVPVVEGE